ncbi:BamA/TamA family outer membrane protein, partial [Bartonella sp. AA86SXKL]
LGGNAKFLKTTGKAMMYKTLSDRMDLVGLLSFGGGYIHEIGREGVRIFDMFKINTDMIRGFKYNGIGPRQVSNKGEVYFLG